jgi:ABC-type nitrate/sulfonate/bicarbonate transport system substrate-binding protein
MTDCGSVVAETQQAAGNQPLSDSKSDKERNMMRRFESALVFAIAMGISSAAHAQDKKLTTLNVGYSAISGSFAPLWVGYDHGLFAKHGLDLKMAYIQGNRVMLSALTAGEIDLYQAAPKD